MKLISHQYGADAYIDLGKRPHLQWMVLSEAKADQVKYRYCITVTLSIF